MKYGLMLPNGRNSFSMTRDELHFAKTGRHLPGVEKQIALLDKELEKIEKMLDNWKRSGQTYKSTTVLTLNLRRKS